MADCGFLTHLVRADELEAKVTQLSDTLAGMAPLALLGMKKHLNRIALGRLDPDDLRRDVMRAAASSDLREGAAAWGQRSVHPPSTVSKSRLTAPPRSHATAATPSTQHG